MAGPHDVSRAVMVRLAERGGKTTGYSVATGGRNALVTSDRLTAGTLFYWSDVIRAGGEATKGPVRADDVPLPAGEPFTLEVTADGGVITSFVNGRRAAELSDPANPNPAGSTPPHVS